MLAADEKKYSSCEWYRDGGKTAKVYFDFSIVF